ncbi:MAG: YihA family ribosome biogenesis GTP-binding protein [Peptococcaceae bacterium]|nr:YihA family ribosome biogenesis GTP-binding protein [Peptococcaceae bacterium]
MIIKNAEFVISAVGPKQYPTDGLPEIALAGRSNVGKSSMVNKFVNRKNLARTSSKPGKTQTLNYYRVNNDAFYFVDLPGYGFAQVRQAEKDKWAKFIDAYLTKRENLCGVIQLVDLRHPPSKDDINMYEWLMHMHKDVLVVATKCDKISKGQWLKHIKQVREGLKADKSQQILAFSAETGQGMEELHQWVEARIASVIPEIEE